MKTQRATTIRYTPRQLAAWIGRLQGRRVAVIGDVMLDAFLWGDANRISPEAPVPVVLIERETWALGGAANVAANVAALGGKATLFSVVGGDAEGARLRALAEESGIALGALPAIPGHPTTVKHRVFARNKHMLRFDREAAEPVSEAVSRTLCRALAASIREFDAVVLSDYAKGCVTPALARGVGRICRAAGVPWCVDPKATEPRYRRATILKPNLGELERLSGIRVRTEEDLHRAAARTLKSQGCENLLVTRGQHGMALFGAGGAARVLDGGGQAVSDVTGAGDTVSATLGLALAAGLEVAAAAALANAAGGYVVTLPGTAVAERGALLETLRHR